MCLDVSCKLFLKKCMHACMSDMLEVRLKQIEIISIRVYQPCEEICRQQVSLSHSLVCVSASYLHHMHFSRPTCISLPFSNAIIESFIHFSYLLLSLSLSFQSELQGLLSRKRKGKEKIYGKERNISILRTVRSKHSICLECSYEREEKWRERDT